MQFCKRLFQRLIVFLFRRPRRTNFRPDIRGALRPSGRVSRLDPAEHRSRLAVRPETQRVHHREDHTEISDLQDDRKVHRGDLPVALHTQARDHQEEGVQ